MARVQLRPLKRRRRRGGAPWHLDAVDATLLDLIDRTLNQGVSVTGELVLSLADVELVYLRLGLLLCASDRVR